MVVRGKCHFAEKVINAQKIGAKMVIIIDDHDEDVHAVMPVERGRNTLNQVTSCYFNFMNKYLYYSIYALTFVQELIDLLLNSVFGECKLNYRYKFRVFFFPKMMEIISFR